MGGTNVPLGFHFSNCIYKNKKLQKWILGLTIFFIKIIIIYDVLEQIKIRGFRTKSVVARYLALPTWRWSFFVAGMFTVVDGVPTFQYSLAQWKIIATHYGGLAGLTFVGLLLAAILPCVGLFFCCCRCAGHCGARSQPFDKKHDHCRKVMLSMVLIAVATIIL